MPLTPFPPIDEDSSDDHSHKTVYIHPSFVLIFRPSILDFVSKPPLIQGILIGLVVLRSILIRILIEQFLLIELRKPSFVWNLSRDHGIDMLGRPWFIGIL